MVAQLVEALRCKPECRALGFRWGHRDFFVSLIPSGRTTILESTQPLTEMITRGISWV